MSAETHEFQVEARQLLQLMIHSIYSNKDVFLRELISNASDALDKLRLTALRDEALGADVSDLHISVEADAQARTLTVRDNGIGMSHQDVVQLIGTIASSGTARLLRELKETDDADAAAGLIGQFGVGFYSAFMVADEVTVLTRHAGESQGTRWISRGEGTYTVEALDEAPQGTTVTLHLKPVDVENQLNDYTQAWKIREIIKRYSDFITWPIRMAAQTTAAAEQADEGADAEPASAAFETVNSMKALWARAREEVSDEEYHELYKRISHDWLPRWRPSACRRKGPSSTRPCSSSPHTLRRTCSHKATAAASNCSSSACTSWTTASNSCRPTFASSRASSTHRTSR